MVETAETSNFDEFKGKYCVFMADGLKTKGLHKLCSVFEGVKERFIFIVYKYMCCLINHVYMHSFRNIIEPTEKLRWLKTVSSTNISVRK